MVETKKERFKRIAEKRTNAIINTIRLLGNCSNRNNYDYTNEQIKQIFNAIETELKSAKVKYEKKESKFTLRG